MPINLSNTSSDWLPSSESCLSRATADVQELHDNTDATAAAPSRFPRLALHAKRGMLICLSAFPIPELSLNEMRARY